MSRSKPFLQRNTLNGRSTTRTNLIATLTLATILIGLLFFYWSEKRREQVLESYCGDFGSYGKTLVLFKNNTFSFTYFGCNYNGGSLKGNWSIDGNFLLLDPEIEDELLDTKYLKTEVDLEPVSLDSEKFTICKQYHEGIRI